MTVLYALTASYEYRGVCIDDPRADDAMRELEISRQFREQDPIEGLEGLCFRMDSLKECRADMPRKVADTIFARGIADLVRHHMCLIFSDQAISAVGKLIEVSGELIPFEIKEQAREHFGFHCTREVDAVDQEQSVGNPRIEKYVFFPDAVAGVDVFRTKWPNDYTIFVSHEFAEAVRAAGLTGFDFREVWRSQDDNRRAVGLDEPPAVPESALPATSRGKKTRKQRASTVAPEQRARQMRTPDDVVVVTAESVESDDPQAVIQSSMEFVDALRAEGLTDDEISRDALRSYMLTEFLHHFLDGGFAQFAYNFDAEPAVMELVREAFSAIGSDAALAAFMRAAELLAEQSHEQREHFLQQDFFGDNAERDRLAEADDLLLDALDKEDMEELHAEWLRNLPNLMCVSQEGFSLEVERRVPVGTDAARRKAEVQEPESPEMQCARDLCEQAGLEFLAFTGMMPKDEHQGRRGIGVSFLTASGPYRCISLEDRAILINNMTAEVVLEARVSR